MLFFRQKWRLLLRQKGVLFLLTILGVVLLLGSPTNSAETIKFNYGLLGFKVKVADLKLFTEEGIITNELNFYLKRISPEKQEQFQKFLQQSYDLNPTLVYRFSRTSVGIKMLERLGNFVQIPETINGFYGLRAAIVQTALAPKEANFIDLLENFPTDIKLNLEETLKLVKKISATENQTKQFIANLKSQEKITNKNSLKTIPNLASLGHFSVNKKTINFYDQKRDREIETDLYLPQSSNSKIPLIVVSNGLGARKTRFTELANHLASYGFAVAVLEHPGSNYQRQKDFIDGLYQENFDGTDFQDRPLDISFILDSLPTINLKSVEQIDVENVGIFGYSIGGTTALALAGANIDFAQLATDCNEPLDLTNISILYQCRALEIQNRNLSLKDERIKAAFLFVPFGKSLFSETELKKVTIPMLWQVVDRDFLTSLTKEQLPIYHALKNSDRHLIISENLPHSTATFSKQRSASQKNESRIARKYQNILSLVFFAQYLNPESQLGTSINSHLVKTITEEPYTLHLTPID